MTVYIHALREEGDLNWRASDLLFRIFLSTPSARRATQGAAGHVQLCRYFYPRPPRGGRPTDLLQAFPFSTISIHALREEGDHRAAPPLPPAKYFYPRPPRGGRLVDVQRDYQHHHFYPRPPRGGRLRARARGYKRRRISIHALREEGDFVHNGIAFRDGGFLSTPSARRAT